MSQAESMVIAKGWNAEEEVDGREVTAQALKKVVDVDERLREVEVDGTRGSGGVAQVLGHDGDLARLSVPGRKWWWAAKRCQ